MKKVLVINSDQNQRLLIKDELEKEGYEVLISPSPEETEEIIKHFHPDVITLDVMIPVVEGIRFLKSLKKQEKKTPLILCTDSAEYKQVFQGEAKDILVVKSADLVGLKEALKRIFSPAR